MVLLLCHPTGAWHQPTAIPLPKDPDQTKRRQLCCAGPSTPGRKKLLSGAGPHYCSAVESGANVENRGEKAEKPASPLPELFGGLDVLNCLAFHSAALPFASVNLL